MNTNIIYMNSKRFNDGLKVAAGSPKLMAVNADQLAGLNMLKNDTKVVSMMNNEQQEIVQGPTVVDMPAATEMPKEENIVEQSQVATPTPEITQQENVIQNNVESQTVMDIPQTPPVPDVVSKTNGDTIINNPATQEPIKETPVVNEPVVNMSEQKPAMDLSAPAMESAPAVDISISETNNSINNTSSMENSSVDSVQANSSSDEYREQMAANAELQRKVQEIFDTAKREAMAAIGDFLEKNSKKKMSNNSANLVQKEVDAPAMDLGTGSVIQMPTPEVNLGMNAEVPPIPSVVPEMNSTNNGITESASIQNEVPAIDLQPMGMVSNGPITPPQSMGEVPGQVEEQSGPVLARVA